MNTSLRTLQTKCVVCDIATNLSIDHVLPLSKGFGLKPGNAIILCRSCNSSKNARQLHQLLPEVAEKIIIAAEQFKIHWEESQRILGN
jgi:5-methylcytosine-specific restriction endonuclease McrA